ncbi:MAG: transglutaminase family protein [Thiohalocapsa sp.]|nr:transglutaminase family protein [Thiohalocapsa sp.]MCF7988943.1 transglutaminase family protein [Thiohalocapsa sp.]
MNYRIERIDRLHFSAAVREHHFECRVAPWDDATQRLKRFEVLSEPTADFASHRDGFGNQVHRSALLGAHDALAVRVRADVETLLPNPFDFEPVAPAREGAWIADSLRQAPRLWDFVLYRSALTPVLTPATATELLGEGDCWPGPGEQVPMLERIQQALQWIGDRFEHDPAQREPAQTLAEVVGRDACHAADLAHLAIAIVRAWGMPARFAAGYVDADCFESDDDPPRTSEPLPQTLHYWMEALVPGAGWRGFDAARGLLADDSYVRLAVGRDRHDVRGFRHSYKGDGEYAGVETEIDVQRLD